MECIPTRRQRQALESVVLFLPHGNAVHQNTLLLKLVTDAAYRNRDAKMERREGGRRGGREGGMEGGTEGRGGGKMSAGPEERHPLSCRRFLSFSHSSETSPGFIRYESDTSLNCARVLGWWTEFYAVPNPKQPPLWDLSRVPR